MLQAAMKSLNNINWKKPTLDKFFYPKSIAVIGASEDTFKIGGYIFSEIKKLKNVEKYPINVKSSIIQNHRAYVNVEDIENPVDLAIIAIPVKYTLDAVESCIRADIKNLVIITAGFKETGDEGKRREDKLKQIIKENNLNVIGPNCLGILNPQTNLNCSFAKDIPPSGDIALISQSGAVIDGIIDWSFKNNIGFSKIVSMGNMAGVGTLQMLEYLKNDPNTKSIFFYMETLDEGKKFAKVLKETTEKKPVIIIKPGNSDNAKKAIGSHTGSMAQDSVLARTLIEENGGILVESLSELFDMLIALKSNIPANKKIAILTNAGGPGVIATDFVSEYGFELYKLDENQKSQFNFLPDAASLNNPIDILGDAKSDRYSNALRELAQIDEIGSIFIILTPQIMTDCENIAKKLAEIKNQTDKCIFSCFIGDKEVKSAIEHLDKNNFSNFQTPMQALKSINYLCKYKKSKEKENTYNNYALDKTKINLIKQKISKKSGLLDFETTKEVLSTFAINLPEKTIIRNREEIQKISLESNKKYVIKADSSELIHKKDIGGVELGIDSTNVKTKIEEMFNTISRNTTNEFTITIEEEIEGTETIIGLKQDSTLGNFIMFGLGGTYANLFKDIQFSTCPLSIERAKETVEKTKVFKMLNGYRGSKPIYFEHLYELLIRMSYLQETFPEIKEVDLNPVICNERGVYLVDVKLIL